MEPVQGNDVPSDRDEMLIEEARREMRGSPEGRRSDTLTNGGAGGGGSAWTGSDGRTGASTAPPSGTEPPAPRGNGVPERIAHYHVKRRIAATHMSVVYEATQEHPRRTVAIKVMKRGRSSRRGLRRFLYESQILARLRHPSIAHVYDAGWYVTDGERLPFFAMEYLPNARSLTEYASQSKLSVAERLRLFIDVCEALHHGHQKSVIHRDVKPGNILVDGDGQVKVIDFGVARATDADMNVTTQQTSVGEMVGTLRYMSPEQCKADPNDLDIRSDIYSLGVVLYELLAGRMPYDLDSTPIEAPKIICEEPPTRLSTIDRSLRGDLETITETALEKDRRRRYQSALAMADDIKRYLSDEPILARPPSAVYRFKKLVRRRRVPLAAAAVVVAMTIGVTAVQVQAWAAQREHEYEQARLRQEHQFQQEQLRREQEYVTNLSELMENTVLSVDKTDSETLSRVIRSCSEVVALEPDDAAVLALRGKLYVVRGEDQYARRDCSRALALDPGNKLALRTCGLVAQRKGDFDEARSLYEKGLQGFAVSTDLARDYHNRARVRRLDHEYDKAMTDHDRAVALSPEFTLPWKGRGVTRYIIGEIDGAIADLEQVAALAASDQEWHEVVRSQLWIWEMRMRRNGEGDRDAAEAAFAEAEEAARYDPRTKDLFRVLSGGLVPEAYLNSLDGPEAPSDRAQGAYYIGVMSLLEGQKQAALEYLRKAADEVLHRHDEYDLARWHLRRLADSE